MYFCTALCKIHDNNHNIFFLAMPMYILSFRSAMNNIVYYFRNRWFAFGYWKHWPTKYL